MNVTINNLRLGLPFYFMMMTFVAGFEEKVIQRL